MTRPLDDDLRELLARRADVDEHEVARLRAFTSTLPSRSSLRRGLLAAAAGIVLLLGFSGLVLVGSLRLGTSGAAPDARLAVCGVTADDALVRFDMAHLRDYPLHLPASRPLDAPAADPDAPVLVIVLRGPSSGGESPGTVPSRSHDLCLVVGSGEQPWTRIDIPGVDTTGMVEVLPEPFSTPIAADLAPWAARCGADIEGVDILEVVRVDHGADIASRLVLDPEPPELATDVPAAVIVYDITHPFPPLGTPPALGATIGPRQRPAEGRHDICVLVGSDPTTAERSVHEDVAVQFLFTRWPPLPWLVSQPPSPVPSPALPAQVDPAECAAMKFAEDRCLAVVEAALGWQSLTWDAVTSVNINADRSNVTMTTAFVASVTFRLRDGSSVSEEVRCGVGGQYSLVCTDRPEIRLSSPINGYQDVPCGAVPGGEPGSACATPMPAIDP